MSYVASAEEQPGIEQEVSQEVEQEVEQDAEQEEEQEPGDEAGDSDETQEEESDGETEKATGTEDAEETDTEYQLTTEDFAQLLNVDSDRIGLDDDGSMVIRTKVDGVDETVTFKDVLHSYQLKGHVDNQSREVASQKKAFQEETEKYRVERETSLDMLTKAIKYNQDRALAPFQKYTPEVLADLRASDPGEYSAVLADFNKVSGEFRGAMAQVNAQRDEITKEQQEAYTNSLKKQDEKMVAKIPGWNDPKTFKKEFDGTYNWAAKHFSEWGDDPKKMLKGIASGSVVAMMNKARLYDELEGTKPTLKKRVRSAPKLVKSNTPVKTKSKSKAQSETNLRRKIQKSGGKDKVAIKDLLMAKGIV